MPFILFPSLINKNPDLVKAILQDTGQGNLVIKDTSGNTSVYPRGTTPVIPYIPPPTTTPSIVTPTTTTPTVGTIPSGPITPAELSALGAKSSGPKYDISGWPGPQGETSTQRWARTFSPERLRYTEEEAARLSGAAEAQAWRSLGPNWKQITDKLQSPPPPEIQYYLDLAEKDVGKISKVTFRKNEGGLTPDEMAAYEKAFEKYYGVSLQFIRAQLPQVAHAFDVANKASAAYTTAAGPLMPLTGESDQARLQRLQETFMKAQADIAGKIVSFKTRPEMMDIGITRQNAAKTAQAQKDMNKFFGLSEGVKAEYEQKYGTPLLSEQLAMWGTDTSLANVVKPRDIGAGRAGPLAASIFVGEFEGLGKTASQLFGQPFSPGQKYRRPVDIFSVWGHPAAAKYTSAEKLTAAIGGGGTAYALQFWVGGKAINPVIEAGTSAVKGAVEAAKLEYWGNLFYGYPLKGDLAKLFKYGAEKLPETKIGQFLFKSQAIKNFFAPSTELSEFGWFGAETVPGGTNEIISMRPSGVYVSEAEAEFRKLYLKTLKNVGLRYEIGGPVTDEMRALGIDTRGGFGTITKGGVQKAFTGSLGFEGEPIMVEVGYASSGGGKAWSLFSRPSPEVQYLLGGESSINLSGRVGKQLIEVGGQTTLFGEPAIKTSQGIWNLKASIAGQQFFEPLKEFGGFGGYISELGNPSSYGVANLFPNYAAYEKIPFTVAGLQTGADINISWGISGVPWKLKAPYSRGRILGLFGEPTEATYELLGGGGSAVDFFKPSGVKSSAAWAKGFQDTLKATNEAAAAKGLLTGTIQKAPTVDVNLFSIGLKPVGVSTDILGGMRTVVIGSPFLNLLSNAEEEAEQASWIWGGKQSPDIMAGQGLLLWQQKSPTILYNPPLVNQQNLTGVLHDQKLLTKTLSKQDILNVQKQGLLTDVLTNQKHTQQEKNLALIFGLKTSYLTDNLYAYKYAYKQNQAVKSLTVLGTSTITGGGQSFKGFPFWFPGRGIKQPKRQPKASKIITFGASPFHHEVGKPVEILLKSRPSKGTNPLEAFAGRPRRGKQPKNPLDEMFGAKRKKKRRSKGRGWF